MEPDPPILPYIEATIKKHGIDASHGKEHLARVGQWCSVLWPRVQPLTDLQPEVELATLLLAAWVHDLIDKKYMDEQEGLCYLQAELSRLQYTPTQIECISFIITHMSWSTRGKRKKQGLPGVPESRWKKATEFIADCDMLDGYNPWRCKEYTEHHLNLSPNNPACIAARRQVMEGRVLKYLTEELHTDAAREVAQPLHEMVKDHIATYLTLDSFFYTQYLQLNIWIYKIYYRQHE